LRAVSRAASRCKFDLVRRLDSLISALDLNAELRAVTHAVATELGADARLARAERLGIRVPRRRAEIAPHSWQLFLRHAKQVDALTARDLHHRDVVPIGDVGDASQLRRARDTTVNARNHTERAVLL